MTSEWQNQMKNCLTLFQSLGHVCQSPPPSFSLLGLPTSQGIPLLFLAGPSFTLSLLNRSPMRGGPHLGPLLF